VLGAKFGRLVAAHFADPKRLAALGSAWFVRFAGHCGLGGLDLGERNGTSVNVDPGGLDRPR